MKRKELMKKCKKVFSAVLAAAMITTSVVPESLVLAADVEETQGFGDSESMESQPRQDDASDDSAEEQQDAPGIQDENLDDSENEANGFIDGADAFSNENNEVAVMAAQIGLVGNTFYVDTESRDITIAKIVDFTNNHDGTLTAGTVPTISPSTCTYSGNDYLVQFKQSSSSLEAYSKNYDNIETFKKNSNYTGLYMSNPITLKTNDKVKIGNVSMGVGITSWSYVKDGYNYFFTAVQDLINPVKVNYNLQSGTDGPSTDWVWTVDNEWKSDHNTIPTRKNYIFGGWYTGTNGSGIKVETVAQAVNNASVGDNQYKEITLYAKWIPHTHSWHYGNKGSDMTIVEAYCTEDSNKCDYYGEDNALQLTLMATEDEPRYDGNTHGAAITENNITSVTNAAASEPRYYLLQEDGTEIETTMDNSGASTQGGAPVNAGSYVAKVSIGTATAKAYYTIGKADISPSVEITDWAYGSYNQSVNGPELDGNSGGGSVTYTYKKKNADDSTYIEVTADTFPNLPAGEYTLKATVEATKNYKGSFATCDFTVAKQQISAPSIQEKVYNGANQTADIEISENSLYTVETNDGGVNVGSYDVVLKLKDPDNYKWAGQEQESAKITVSFVITKNTNSWTKEPAITGWIYGEHAIAPTAKAIFGTGTLIVEYRSENDEDTNYSQMVPTNAGNYKVRFTVPGTENYAGLTAVKDLTIEPKTISIVWGATDFTYNGVEQKPTADAAPESLGEGDSCQITVSGAKKDVGTYTAEASISNPNYKLPAETTKEYTIGAKEIGIKWSNLEFTYDGNQKQPTASATGLVDRDTCGITVSGAAVDAGTHTAKADSVDNANYKLPKDAETEFVINKAETIVSKAPEIISGLTYTGEAQDLISAGQTKDGKFVYKVNGGEWSETIPSGLDVGNYEISYKVAGDGNHNDSEEGKFTVTIAKKAVIVSGITAKNKTYDGNTNAVLSYEDVKFDGILEKDSLSVTATGIFEDKNVGQKKVLISNWKLDGASAKNYVLAAEEQQTETIATIYAKEITAVITPNGGIYEGTITPATAVMNELVGEEKPEITLTYTGTANDGTKADGNVPTHAGTYTVTASITDGNYSLNAEGASAEFVVAKADPAFSVSAIADKNYGEEAFKLETSNKGDGQKSYTSSDGEVVTVEENGLVTIVGAGEATLTVSLAESANYNGGEKTVTVTVKKVDHNLVIEKINYEVTYGDLSFEIATSAGDKEKDIKFTSDDKEVASVSADGIVTVGKAGTAKITVSMDESQNYLAVAKEVTVTVVPKEIGLTWIDTNLTYNGQEQQPKAEATGLVGNDTCEVTVTGAKKNTNAIAGSESYTATAVNLSNPNYKLPSETTTQYTISAKEIGIDWSNQEFTYDGTQKQLTAKATGLAEGDTCVITVSGAATEAGTYTAKAESVDNANYKLSKDAETKFVINKAETTISQAPEIVSNLTYTGKAQDLISAGQTADGKFVYKVNDGEWSETIPSGLDAGIYEISYKVVGDANHNDSAEIQLTATIAKKIDQSGLSGNAISKLDLPILLANGKGGNKQITLSWLKYTGASGYECYWSYCDGKKNFKKFAAVKNGKLTATHKKLNNDRKYKYFVAAYKMVNGEKVYIARSNNLHVAMSASDKTNAFSVTVNKRHVTLKKNKTFTIKATTKLENPAKKQLAHTDLFRYYTTNSKVATVSAKGVIKAKGKGTCKIYVLANNGVFKSIKVKVK